MNATSALILLIDDDALLRENTRFLLEDFNFSVIDADGGRSGLQAFKNANPDLVLVDIYMPDMNVLDVLKEIRESHPQTPVIMMSGSNDIKDVVKAMELGAWNYIIKPIQDVSILVHAINKEIHQARLIKENQDYREHLEKMVFLRTRQLDAAYAKLENNDRDP